MSDRARVRNEISLMEGGDALPRKSGDLVFHDSWERRVFAIAVVLYEQGHYDWEDFRKNLIGEIQASGESAVNPKPERPGYYEHWLNSLEKLLKQKAIT